MIKTLRKKFVLINMLLVSIVLVVVFLVLCTAAHERMSYSEIMALEAHLERKEGQRAPKFEVGKNPTPDFMRDPFFVAAIDENGKATLISADNINITDEQLEWVVSEAQASASKIGILREHNLRFLKSHGPGGVRIAFVDLSGNNTAMRLIMLASLMLLLLALTAFFFISLFLSKWAMRPVEQALRQQRQFVADASHELKTPLTVILANTGILKSNREYTVESQMNWVENTEAEAGRMKKLIDNLLFLAKSDDAKAPMIHSELNLSDIAFGTALAFESVAYERGIEIDTAQISPDVRISGDEGQLSQLIGILLDNAVKYSEDGGAVTLSLAARQDKAVFSVHNNGSHLKQWDLEHVFDRFYRADESRANEGYGLGLSIAKSIAENHHGKITADSGEETGTVFTVAIPLQK